MAREPKQARSRALVSSIVEATLRVLPNIGSSRLTTTKIAEVAGVSVGSLYQYFPNKDALVGTIIDSWMKGAM